MLVGLVLRFWDLGAKAFHHDESLHAFYSWRLYDGQGYVHDPMMHGPLLFELNALVYLLFGASDFTARLVPALLGVGRHRHAVLPAARARPQPAPSPPALLFVVSPAFLYFSRFIRHDIYVDVFTLLLVIGVFRYLATGQRKLVLHRLRLRRAAVRDQGRLLHQRLHPVRVPGRQLVPAQGRAPPAVPRPRPRARRPILGRSALGVVRGDQPAAVHDVPDQPAGRVHGGRHACRSTRCAGSTGALSYWLQQQDFARGGQPWFYYFMLLPLYEFVPLILGLLAIALVRPRQLFFWFCAFWFVAALLIYSWAGEKMPWMLPQITLPLILLAGRLLGQWADAGWGRRALDVRAAWPPAA